MSNAGSATSGRFNAFAFYDLRDALPAFVAIAVLFAADATVDDIATLALIVVADVLGMFAAFAYLGAGDRGERRRARERFSAALDVTERKARRAAARLTLVVAIVIAVIAGGGLPDAKVAVAAMVAGVLLGQVVFALWLNARHSPPDPRG
jgi:hypothetical protein